MQILILIFISLILASCGGFKDAGKVLRNEKTTTNDEFLVRKKNPLVLPPDYNKLPEPGSLSTENDRKNEDKIKSILKVPKETTNNKNPTSSVEQSIIDGIRKW